MTSKKTFKAAMIDRAGRTWNTKPERQFNEYQESRGMGLVQNVKLPFVAPTRDGRLQRLEFQLDFAHPTDKTYDIDFEVDGEHYHSSNIQAAKDQWKDRLKNEQGLKVVHIPAVLTEKKWWAYLDAQLPRAVLAQAPTVYVVA